MGDHSLVGGSGAYRWMNCPGSVRLIASLPPKPSSEAADEGTAAHALAAYCLKEGERFASHFIGGTPDGRVGAPVFTIAMCEAVQVYLDAVWEEMDTDPDAYLYVEENFELPLGDPGEAFGTVDALVWHPKTGRLRVFDYKHGVGTLVDAEDNDQAQYYAAGAIANHTAWDVKEIEVTIVQPRSWQDGEKVRNWIVHPVDLGLWVEEARDALTATKRADAPFKVGPWCEKTFCDAIAFCPMMKQTAEEVAGVSFEKLTADVLPLATELTIAQLEEIVLKASILATWARKAEEHLESLLMQGHQGVAFKVVEKLGRRKYVENDEEIVEFIDMVFGIPPDVATRTQLQTLTEMKKILKQHGATKEQIDDFELRFTVKESSGLTMAPASDRRPAVTPNAADFGSVNLTAE